MFTKFVPIKNLLTSFALAAALAACNSGTSTINDTDTDTDIEVDTDVSSDLDSDTDTDSSTDTGQESDTSSDTDSETDTASDTGSDTGTENTDTGSGSSTDTGSTDTGSETGTSISTLDPNNIDTTDSRLLWVLPAKTGATDDGSCSFDAPCLTIQKAINTVTDNNQIILVGEGTYAEALSVSRMIRVLGGVTSETASDGTETWKLDPKNHVATIDLVAAAGSIAIADGGDLNIDGFTISASTNAITLVNGFLRVNGCAISAADGSSDVELITAKYDEDFAKSDASDTSSSSSTSTSTSASRSRHRNPVEISKSKLSIGTITVPTDGSVTSISTSLVKISSATQDGKAIDVKITESKLHGPTFVDGSASVKTRYRAVAVLVKTGTVPANATLTKNTITLPVAKFSTALHFSGVKKIRVSHNEIKSLGAAKDLGIAAIADSATQATLKMDNNLLVVSQSDVSVKHIGIYTDGVKLDMLNNTLITDTKVKVSADVSVEDKNATIKLVNNILRNQSRRPYHILFNDLPEDAPQVHNNLFYSAEGAGIVGDAEETSGTETITATDSATDTSSSSSTSTGTGESFAMRIAKIFDALDETYDEGATLYFLMNPTLRNYYGVDPLLDNNYVPQKASPVVDQGYDMRAGSRTSTATSSMTFTATASGTGTDTAMPRFRGSIRPSRLMLMANDLGGHRRVSGDHIDMGAYEYQYPVDRPRDDSSDDADHDGVVDSEDNCSSVMNADQTDTDADGIGNLCDDDIDGDGSLNTGSESSDLDDDGDGLSDAEDSDADGNGVDDVYQVEDYDEDGIAAGKDNCPNYPNVDQTDMDRDGLGNLCDDDIDGDGLVNDNDSDSEDKDDDNDGILDSDDDDDNATGVDDIDEFWVDPNFIIVL